MNEQVRRACVSRGIGRLCHFTPSRNLAHIACDEVGVLATQRLKTNERSVFNPTDLERLDGHEGHICCSIEYPNAWYFENARAREPLFPDWVVLLIRPDYLWKDETLFCPRNAAAGRGRGLSSALAGFEALFAHSVSGARGRTYIRTPQRLPSMPTDEQAEVLIADRILLRDILAVAVRDEEQARNEIARLRILNHEDSFRFVVAPDLFDKWLLSSLIRGGDRPPEVEWT